MKGLNADHYLLQDMDRTNGIEEDEINDMMSVNCQQEVTSDGA